MSDGRGFDQAVRALEKLLAERADDEAQTAGRDAEPADGASAQTAEN
jgi:hypothetical protein